MLASHDSVRANSARRSAGNGEVLETAAGADAAKT